MLTTFQSNLKPDQVGVTKSLMVALVGQPNVGKSTIFNELTGGVQYVSNWPGKTCEEKLGFVTLSDTLVTLVDLPGAYSLTAASAEERMVRDFLLCKKADVVALIVNAATLEHNLYLLAEVLTLPVKVVVCLNMMDIAQQEGMQIEPHVLQAALGCPVVPIVAVQRQGLNDLLEAAARLVHGIQIFQPNRPEIREDHRQVLQSLLAEIVPYVPDPYPADWTAMKLLEGDREITWLIKEKMGPAWEAVHAILRAHDDAALAIAGGRYDWIGRMIRAAVVNPRAGQVTLTDRIDRFATHPYWGLLILLGIMGALFGLTYALGTPLQNWLDLLLVQTSAEWAGRFLSGAPAWIQGLVINGIIAGVGTVLTLLPILLIFFASLSFLEDVGYMARAAFVMDRFMHRIGLHGQSFLPLFLGFGCNVPAVMSTRIIDAPKARLSTILITPLIPCTARMAVVSVLAPIFFFRQAYLVTLGLVGLSLIMVMGIGALLHKVFLGGESKAFIMELPLYHFPNLHTIGLSIWQRLVDFLQMAGTLILVVSVILWALSTFPGETIESSYLGWLGHGLAPLGRLMGLDWQMLVALLTSFVRKENTIPTLAVLYAPSSPGLGLAHALSNQLTPVSAMVFLVVQILFIPCMATLATIRQETRSWKWTLLSVVLLFVISFGSGILIYQSAIWLGWGS